MEIPQHQKDIEIDDLFSAFSLARYGVPQIIVTVVREMRLHRSDIVLLGHVPICSVKISKSLVIPGGSILFQRGGHGREPSLT